jgi:hypothetical protein
MSHLRDLDNTIHKNVLTQFLISCQKIYIKKKKSHTLSKLKLMEKAMNRQVMNNGISIFLEMNPLYVIYSMDNSNQLCNVQYVREYQ